MEQLNINHILYRNLEEKKFIECLEYFEKEKQNVLTKRGIYGVDNLEFLLYLYSLS